MKRPLLSALLLCMASGASAQLAPDTEAWGEPVDGVQLRLALATSGPPAHAGALPVMEVQIRNLGATRLTVHSEVLIFANIEIDEVWYGQVVAVTAPEEVFDIAPGSTSKVVRTIHFAAAMYEMNARPARAFVLRPGPHRIRVRTPPQGRGVNTPDGKALPLVSNQIVVSFPDPKRETTP